MSCHTRVMTCHVTLDARALYKYEPLLLLVVLAETPASSNCIVLGPPTRLAQAGCSARRVGELSLLEQSFNGPSIAKCFALAFCGL